MSHTSPTAETFVDRPLALRMRPDLVVRELSFRGRTHWTVKDPLTLAFYHFSEAEFSVLRWLDGRSSLRTLQQQFERRFAPMRLELAKIQAFLSQLHQQGLVVADASRQGDTLLARRDVRRRQQWWQQFANPLAIRFRGINPQRWLSLLTGPLGLFFSLPAFLVWLTIVGLTAAMIFTHGTSLWAKLPTAQAWLQTESAGLLVATFIAVKLLHELGHAAACQRFGGRCHELGVQFLVFVPCLYCDVTDAWLLPNKWQRIAVSAGGMYLEIGLAAIAAWLWWGSEPGLLNSLCFNVMVVASIGTLAFNANPLLRYDGYYMLSDFIESPNLDTRSRRSLGRVAACWLLGIELPASETLADEREPWLPLFAAAALAYRLLVFVAIYWFLVQLLEPWHLAFVADLLIASTVVLVAIQMLSNMRSCFRQPAVRRQLRPGRIRGVLLATVASLLIIAFCPLPHRVSAPLMLELESAERVFVTVPGTLIESVAAGEHVTAGQIVTRLENPDLRRELLKLEAELARQTHYLAFLESKRGDDPQQAALIPATKESLADLARRSGHLQSQLEQLTLRAPRDGTVFRPTRVAATNTNAFRLVGWTGTPLDEHNRGSQLAPGTEVCVVGDRSRMAAVAIVDQSAVDFVREQQPVRLRCNTLPGHELTGVVRSVARIKLDDQARPFVAAGLVPTKAHRHGDSPPQAIATAYQVRIDIAPTTLELVPGSFGDARITAAPLSIGQRLVRYLSSTFRFRESSRP